MIEFALLVAILFATGWLVVHGRGHPLLRGAVVFGLIVSSVGLLERVDRFRGTPREAEMPDEVLVHGFLVSEGTGEIYLFCGEAPPESLLVTYERPLHEALVQGQSQFGGLSFVLGKEGEGGNGDGDGEGEEGEGDLSTESERRYFVELPKPLLPVKE